GFWAALLTGSAGAGIAAGAAAAALLALLFGTLTVRSRADQIVVGTGINLLALGLTGALYRGIFGETGSALAVRMLPRAPVPGLSQLPLVGPALFRQNLLLYLAFALAP